ncbi:hypothetical protein [Streptomyces xiamenensis]|uniref:hypothetical protein n=1 Tax=Streptomyces xiamenensis TaxID=408015 RepID=UPI0035DEDFFB
MAATTPSPTLRKNKTTTGKRADVEGVPVEDGGRAPGGALAARIAAIRTSPGLYAGSGLALASQVMPTGPLAVTTAGAAAIAGGWATLGVLPGPWRWLPGHGEPWEWMCRSSRRGYRRTLRRMRRRLAQDTGLAPAEGTAGLLVPVLTTGDAWYEHGGRPALVRAATADYRRARCDMLRAVWSQALPNWERGWWRRYTPTEMALRAAPLAAIPAAGFADLPWWGVALTASLAGAWGVRVWQRPDPAPAPEPADEAPVQGPDWYVARWQEWIAGERGPLPGSRLTSLRVDEDGLSAVIVSTTTRPALAVDQDAVSIAWEVPARAVNIYRPADMPSGRAKLKVRLRAAADTDPDDLAAVWAQYSPYAGSKLLDPHETNNGRRFQLEMPRKGSSVVDVQARAIAQALDLPGEDAIARLHLRVLDARRIEVSEMTVNPLQGGVPLDLDALVMDEKGYVTVGKDVYGRPARWRLMIPNPGKFGMNGGQGMSAVHSFSSGTTGSGKSSLEETLLIAQRVNGMVGWLADGKYGAGFASWLKEVDWLVKSHFGAMLMGQAAAAVGQHRFSVQMKSQWRDAEGYVMDGRSFFVPHEPFAPMQVTFDEFNEMVLDGSKAHVKPLLESLSNLGRQTRSAGIACRVYVQIPNLDSIGTDKNANAIRDMLQSGNIALFRTARSDVDVMSLGARTPEFRLEPIRETFPDGSGTGGLGYIADGSSQYTQSRMMFHPNPVRIARDSGIPLPALTDGEAEAAGVAYQRRDEYRHMDASEEEAFLRDLIAREQSTPNRSVFDLHPAPAAPAAEEDGEDDDALDDIVPPTRSQLVWTAVDGGARRNKTIAEVTNLKPPNVANATRRLERLRKLHKVDRDWHTLEPLDA